MGNQILNYVKSRIICLEEGLGRTESDDSTAILTYAISELKTIKNYIEACENDKMAETNAANKKANEDYQYYESKQMPMFSPLIGQLVRFQLKNNPTDMYMGIFKEITDGYICIENLTRGVDCGIYASIFYAPLSDVNMLYTASKYWHNQYAKLSTE